ncbi:hypothetical protein HO173_002273 [Letharia columbiana]|uniref:Uncharacterized protein n=1 Tax=Letharia columbiana TaxID=112416 RepID=A0A8H6G379_9LECA|nr:uncharacterized protein HO173_002273 [Letharia columbiana]KAF6239727.1 hypothetical protein HO173_002273 [Letharia columbiana]
MSFVNHMTNSLETAVSQAPEGGPGNSNSSFDMYTGSGSVEDKSLVRKQDWRIIPLCAVVYLLFFWTGRILVMPES